KGQHSFRECQTNVTPHVHSVRGTRRIRVRRDGENATKREGPHRPVLSSVSRKTPTTRTRRRPSRTSREYYRTRSRSRTVTTSPSENRRSHLRDSDTSRQQKFRERSGILPGHRKVSNAQQRERVCRVPNTR